jgi:hypothetical protein
MVNINGGLTCVNVVIKFSHGKFCMVTINNGWLTYISVTNLMDLKWTLDQSGNRRWFRSLQKLKLYKDMW